MPDPYLSNPAFVDLGWTPALESQLASLDGSLIPGRLAAERRGQCTVLTPAPLVVSTSGRLQHEALNRLALPAVGDWVGLRVGDDGGAVIHHVFERTTRFVRSAAGKRTEAQVIAANIDVVAVVTALNGDFNVRRLERYLQAIRQGGARPLFVLSKSDLASDPAAQRAEIEARAGDVPVIIASVVDDVGLGELRAFVGRGTTLALVGSSGAGKSTLVNRLLGRDTQATGDIREGDDRGRHTTTHRELFAIPGGGLLIDTPGMREISAWAGDDEAEVDVTAGVGPCRFRDCTHGAEPGCAVALAVAEGRIQPAQLAHQRALERELLQQRAKQDANARLEVKRRDKRLAQAIKRVKKS